MTTILVRNAGGMMTAAGLLEAGIQCTFADGASGMVPYADVPEIEGRSAVTGLELPNAYEMIVTLADGQRIEIPWDFVRHYCDRTYRATMEAVAAAGQKTLGQRIRRLRESQELTQDQLSRKAAIGRVTLARLESGGQSPRFKTLTALAQALEVDVSALILDS